MPRMTIMQIADGKAEAQLNRLHGPIGPEIGAGTPEEIAMSIMAEIVSARNNPARINSPFQRSERDNAEDSVRSLHEKIS